MKSNEPNERPDCYGDLDTVFPLREDGFRASPVSCLQCIQKTECLRKAMGKRRGLSVREEMIDRAYRGGVIGFFNRWSKKKRLHQQKKKTTS